MSREILFTKSYKKDIKKQEIPKNLLTKCGIPAILYKVLKNVAEDSRYPTGVNPAEVVDISIAL